MGLQKLVLAILGFSVVGSGCLFGASAFFTTTTYTASYHDTAVEVEPTTALEKFKKSRSAKLADSKPAAAKQPVKAEAAAMSVPPPSKVRQLLKPVVNIYRPKLENLPTPPGGGLYTAGHNLSYDNLIKIPGAWAVDGKLSFYSIDYRSTGKYPGDPAYGITALGVNVKDCKYKGRCTEAAANFGWLGYKKTKIWIEGLGFRVISDTGSAFVGTTDRFDILVPTDDYADQLGRKVRRVIILPDNYPMPAL